MTKKYYVSKLENGREWVLGQFEHGDPESIEWTAATGAMADYRVESTNFNDMEELATHFGGSVEEFNQ